MIDALLCNDLDGICRLVDAALTQGEPLHRIYLDRLAPAAAAIDRLTATDACPAAAGALAFCNLRIVLRRYAAEGCGEDASPLRGSRVLLVSAGASGSLPLFNLLIAGDLLRRAGCDSWTEQSLQSASFTRTLRAEWFDCIHVLGTCRADDAGAADERHRIAAGVALIRRESANHGVEVAAWGAAFGDDPALPVEVGADHGGGDLFAALPHLQQIFASSRIAPAYKRHLS